MFVSAGLLALNYMFRQGKHLTFEQKLFVPATPLLVCLVFSLLVCNVIPTPGRDWNAARITPSVSLKHGYTLYYPQDKGPILNTLYAPMTTVLFLPSASAKDPTSAVLIAGAINTGSMAFSLL
tara:strand:- start:1213 stop:1581 length:369 start_codon:yes stop_codon:yes gene_type:complete